MVCGPLKNSISAPVGEAEFAVKASRTRRSFRGQYDVTIRLVLLGVIILCLVLKFATRVFRQGRQNRLVRPENSTQSRPASYNPTPAYFPPTVNHGHIAIHLP